MDDTMRRLARCGACAALSMMSTAAPAAHSTYQCYVSGQADTVAERHAPSRLGQWFGVDRDSGRVTGPVPALEPSPGSSRVTDAGTGGHPFEVVLGDERGVDAAPSSALARLRVNEQEPGAAKSFVATTGDGLRLSGTCK